MLIRSAVHVRFILYVATYHTIGPTGLLCTTHVIIKRSAMSLDIRIQTYICRGAKLINNLLRTIKLQKLPACGVELRRELNISILSLRLNLSLSLNLRHSLGMRLRSSLMRRSGHWVRVNGSWYVLLIVHLHVLYGLPVVLDMLSMLSLYLNLTLTLDLTLYLTLQLLRLNLLWLLLLEVLLYGVISSARWWGERVRWRRH